MKTWTRRDLIAATAGTAAAALATARAAAEPAVPVAPQDAPQGVAANTGTGVTIRRQYVDGPWGQIHVRIAVPNRRRDDIHPPLACFHYSPGSARMFDAALPMLARQRTVIAADTPGYGASAAPPAQPTLPEYAAALADGLATLGFGKRGQQFDLLGHLTGSLLALELATTRPRAVRRVVLSRSPAFDAQRRRDFVADVQKRAADRRLDPRASYLVERLQRGLDSRPPGTSPWAYVGTFIDSVSPGDNWAWGDVAAIGYPAEDRFGKLTQPVLLLAQKPAGDPSFERTPGLIPGVRVIEIEGSLDWAWQLEPGRIATAVNEFLDARS